MILLTRGAGRPSRIDHARSIVVPAPLDQVTAAIEEYAESGGGAVCVERLGDRYRWSPAVRGGPYPLTRVVARFLDCRHTEITVGFVTVDGWCIVGDPDGGVAPDARCVFEDATAPAEIEHRLS